MIDDETRDLVTSIRRSIKSMRTGLDTMDEKLAALLGDAKQSAPASKDEFGEPTWNYRAPRPIPRDIYLTEAFMHYGITAGFTPEQVRKLFDGDGKYAGFKRYFVAKGTKWQEWTLVWQNWLRKSKDDYEKKKAGGGTSRSDGKVANYR